MSQICRIYFEKCGRNNIGLFHAKESGIAGLEHSNLSLVITMDQNSRVFSYPSHTQTKPANSDFTSAPYSQKDHECLSPFWCQTLNTTTCTSKTYIWQTTWPWRNSSINVSVFDYRFRVHDHLTPYWFLEPGCGKIMRTMHEGSAFSANVSSWQICGNWKGVWVWTLEESVSRNGWETALVQTVADVKKGGSGCLHAWYGMGM